ncbi:MAG: hypothetical protein V5A39_10200 [Haloarculaceae archaeon]|jgi:hypothetical protein
MDDRSERLRKRRKESSRKRPRAETETEASETELSTATNGHEADEDEAEDETEEEDQTTSVKEERTGTYMYLPDPQLKDLKRLYNVLKAEYEFEYGESFEKNRHFYPLVIQYGLDGLEEMDVSDIRESLESV